MQLNKPKSGCCSISACRFLITFAAGCRPAQVSTMARLPGSRCAGRQWQDEHKVSTTVHIHTPLRTAPGRAARLVAVLAAVLLGLAAAQAATGGYGYHFKPIDRSFDSIARRLCALDFASRRESITEASLSRLDSLARARGNRQLRARALYWRVRASQMDARPAECMALLDSALALCSPAYAYDEACIKYQLAGNCERMGHYMRSYRLAGEAVAAFAEAGDDYFLGNAYLLLAQLFVDIGDPDNARPVLDKARKAYDRAGFRQGRTFFFEAQLAPEGQRLGLYRQALGHSRAEDWALSLQALTSMAQLFIAEGRLDSARACADGAFRLLDERAPDNRLFRTLASICKARVALAAADYREAAATMAAAEAAAPSMSGERFLADIYECLYLAHEGMGDEAAAYKYLKLFTAEYARNVNDIKRQDVTKARAREAIARSNDRIRLLEQEARLKRDVTYLTLAAAAILALVAVVVFVYLYQRYRIREVENRELRSNITRDALIYSTNRKNFERDMKQKECEISSSTLLLANKNEVLQQLSAITKRYYDEGKVPQEYVGQVNAIIGESLRNDDEWQRFKLHFDSVHPDFFRKLKKLSAELTENDLRLCAYIRIGLRAKQIAEMLSVSPDSVNSNRYRLRKKLGLQRGDSLDDFIRRI